MISTDTEAALQDVGMSVPGQRLPSVATMIVTVELRGDFEI